MAIANLRKFQEIQLKEFETNVKKLIVTVNCNRFTVAILGQETPVDGSNG